MTSYADDFIAYDPVYNQELERRTGKVVRTHAVLMTSEERCWRRLGPEGARKIIEMYNNGVEIFDIQLEMGLRSPTCIYAVLRMFGVKPSRQKRRRKTRRLSVKEMEEMKRLYMSGKSVYEIAKMMNRPTSTVNYTLKRMGVK